jgi:hypothetical protein
MRTYPESKTDIEELNELNAEQWQIDLLKFNPSYVYWGNTEDYMSEKDVGWRSRSDLKAFSEMFEIDDLNECVNFYFEVYRKHHDCEKCERTGLNEATKKLNDDWYSFEKQDWKYLPKGKRYNNFAWQYHLTEIEIEALVKAGRLNYFMPINCHYDDKKKKWYGWIEGKKEQIEQPIFPTPEKINEWAKEGMGHDAINQWICIKARAKQLGIYGPCELCNGKGYIYDEQKAKVGLQLWILHPRKGCSKGVYIEEIKHEDLKNIFKFLTNAKNRNNERFSKIPC